MKQHLSNDLLRRLKLYGYTTLRRMDDIPTYSIGKESLEDLKNIALQKHAAPQKTLIIDTLLLEDLLDEELHGEVILPDEELESDL